MTYGERVIGDMLDRTMLRLSVRVLTLSVGTVIPLFLMFTAASETYTPYTCLQTDCPGFSYKVILAADVLVVG